MTTTLPDIRAGMHAWRLHRSIFDASWDSGEGAFRNGGRWNSKGKYAVYCCLEAAAATLETTVHVGFDILDTVRHTMTKLKINDLSAINIIDHTTVPNTNWLIAGPVSKGQQQFGDTALEKGFVFVPSTVVPECWNLVFDPRRVAGRYELVSQNRYALDTRLNPPVR